jgi:hypothetical protein
MTAGAAVVITVGSFCLSTAAQAAPARAGLAGTLPGTRASVSAVPHRTRMGSYGAARFAQAAAKLPSGLAGQLREQLGITPEQFLADGQAAADAGKVIASLRADGVAVYGAKLNGTTLTVTVPDAAGAAAARADGASAVIGTAQPVRTIAAEAVSSPANGTSALLGGDLWAYYTSAGGGIMCSVGFNGYDRGTGAREFITAGHCGDYKHTGQPAPVNGLVYAATDENPVTFGRSVPLQYPALGSLVQSSFSFGGGVDSGIVKVTNAKAKPRPSVTTWGSSGTTAYSSRGASQGVENRGGTVPILAAAPAVPGEPVCHSGERTGWQCGVVQASAVKADVGTAASFQVVDSFQTSVCLLPGDSGGSFVAGEYAIGIATASSFTPKSAIPGTAAYNSCAHTGPGYYSIAYPMVAAASGEESAAHSEPRFELAVAVPTPVVSAAEADVLTGSGAISGYLPRPFATGTPVSLSLDGHPKASARADSSGKWSFSLAGLARGAHRYTVTAGSGHSTAARSGTFSLGVVTVSGTAQVGKTLRAGVTGVPSDGTVAYQWNENGAVAQTGQTYLIPASSVGRRLTVTATITEGGNSVSVTSGQTAVIAPGTFASVRAPAVTGAVRAGLTVVAYPGTWSVATPTFTYQWLANGVRISGATGAAYIVPASLVGRKLSVTVTAHTSGYRPAARTSAALVIGKGILILKVRPVLSGTPAVGRRLAVTTGTWSPAAAVTIQWYANGVPVSRATSTSLLLTTALRGKVISVIVSAGTPGYATAALRLTESTRVS